LIDDPTNDPLRRAYEATPAMMHTVDDKGRIQYVSDRWLERMGYTRDEVVGRNSLDFLTPESRSDLLQNWVPKFLHTGALDDYPCEFLSQSGEVVPVLLSARIEWDDEGEFGHSRSVLVDVTDQRRAEKEARLGRALLSRLFDALPDAALLTDPDRRIMKVNPSFVRTFGYTEQQVLGKKTEVFYDNSSNYQARGSSHYNSDANIDVTPYRSRYKRRDGSLFDAETMGSALLNEDGKHLGNVGIIRDISERIAAQRREEQMKAQMVRTERLESLAVMAGGIAHDFNNLLSAILGNADVALYDLPKDHPATSPLRDIINASRTAADICARMLTYSGKQRAPAEPLSITPLTDELCQALRVRLGAKARLMTLHHHPEARVQGDAAQIRQVLMNLVLNASEALGDDGGQIIVQTRVQALRRAQLDDTELGADCTPGEYLQIEVRDTGHGMSQDVADRIFDPFFSTKFTGRGLGLASVLGVLRAHKGTIHLKSEKGVGTTFTVSIPLHDTTPHHVIPTPMSDPLPVRHRGTILVVDDVQTVRAVAERMLRRLGYSTRTVEHGRAAVDYVRKHPGVLQAVLLDLTMPEMDGETAFHLIREVEPELPIILMTGYTRSQVSESFSEMDMAGFLAKPFAFQQLRMVLREALADRVGVGS